MPTPAELVSRALGASAASETPESLAAFALDGRAPRVVAFPETPEQVAALLALAYGKGWGVVPWGGGHGMGCGNPPTRYDLALSTTRMAAVVDHDAENLTLTAQAGMTLGEVNRQLRGDRQQLPLGFAGDRSTLGGIVAANRPTLRRLTHGDVRDVLLGVGAALPDGSLVRYGRKVIKNVAGYDMNKLFLGSRGIYGVIVETIFKLSALPDAEAFLLGSFANAGAAAGAAAALLASPLRPSALFLADPVAAAKLDRHGLSHPTGEEAFLLLAGFEGRVVTLRRQMEDGRVLMEKHHARQTAKVEALPPEAEAFLLAPWRGAQPGGTPPTGTPGSGTQAGGNQETIGLQFGVPVSRVAATLEQIGNTLPTLGATGAALTDFSAGILRVAVEPPDANTLAALAGWIASLRQELLPYRGYVVLQAAPLQLKAQVDVWGELEGEADIMALLKQRFDPAHILAPGRFLLEN